MLTAREWLLLPEQEQKQRKNELSSYENFLLRTELAYVHFTEEEKLSLTEKQKKEFIHQKEHTEEEKLIFNKFAEDIFNKLKREVKK